MGRRADPAAGVQANAKYVTTTVIGNIIDQYYIVLLYYYFIIMCSFSLRRWRGGGRCRSIRRFAPLGMWRWATPLARLTDRHVCAPKNQKALTFY